MFLPKRRQPQRTVPAEKRERYLNCLSDAQKIPSIESQNERLDVLDGVLDKYFLLSKSVEPGADEPSSSQTEKHVVGTDERFLMSLVSKSSNEAFGRILTDFTVVPSKFSIIDFAATLQPEEGQRYFDWEKLEVISSTVFRTAPSLSSVWANLDLPLEIKERAAKRQRMTRKLDQQPATKIVPNNVVNEESKKSEEYRQLNRSLRKSFDSNGQRPVNMFELLVDKKSYPATVENMFNFAFLIREDMANLKICDDGTPFVEPVDSKSKELKKSQRKEESNQMILSFDYEKWQNVIKYLEKN